MIFLSSFLKTVKITFMQMFVGNMHRNENVWMSADQEKAVFSF